MGREGAAANKRTYAQVSSPEVDLAALLVDAVRAVEEHPAKLRDVVYELARINLRRECFLSYPRLTVLETRQVLLAFETAVERYENALSQDHPLALDAGTFGAVIANTLERIEKDAVEKRGVVYELAKLKLEQECVRDALTVPETQRLFSALEIARDSINNDAGPEESTAGVANIAEENPVPTFLIQGVRQVGHHPAPRDRSRTTGTGWIRSARPVLQALVLVALLGVSFAKLQPSAPPPELPPPLELVEHSPPVAAEPVRMRLPPAYGVYALNEGELQELEALPGRISDHRIIMSMKPPHTSLPSKQVQFVVYRPDMAMNPWANIEIRVFAKTRPNLWTVGQVTQPFSIVPNDEHPDMLLVSSEVPSGRYVLVIKGQLFDFAVSESQDRTASTLR